MVTADYSFSFFIAGMEDSAVVSSGRVRFVPLGECPDVERAGSALDKLASSGPLRSAIPDELEDCISRAGPAWVGLVTGPAFLAGWASLDEPATGAFCFSSMRA